MRNGEAKNKRKRKPKIRRERIQACLWLFFFFLHHQHYFFLNEYPKLTNKLYTKRVKKQKKNRRILFFLFYTIGQHAGKREIHDNQFELLFLVLFGQVHPMLNDIMVLLNKNIFVNFHSLQFLPLHHHHHHHQINFQDHIEGH